ncbi:Abi family protein [Prevotella copri]|uniref:Abi family protein n=1 Tax=Segatella copri TaxID=165179 RepID=A0AAW5UDY4_9BACT|nr:Abi family protein [Segatella copri]MCW4143668.1 Abi family protein [Segatella copri]MCW4168252.1 Abi family protein [Segatella copri]
MDYDKQPINVDEQVALLQNRGLVIEDIATAKLQLRNISYFRIASYLRYMEEDRQFHHYKLGSTFEQAIDLYLFDKELRQLIFKAIQDIEISLRTKMIQIFSMEHGAFWFMDASLFKNADFYEGCLDNIKKEVSRSNEDFIKEHSEKYTFPSLPPVWKTLEVVSYAFQIILSVQGQSSQKASGKRVWTTSIHLLGKLDKVYNRASQLLCSPCPYME